MSTQTEERQEKPMKKDASKNIQLIAAKMDAEIMNQSHERKNVKKNDKYHSGTKFNAIRIRVQRMELR